jgi:hypothetical protein
MKPRLLPAQRLGLLEHELADSGCSQHADAMALHRAARARRLCHHGDHTALQRLSAIPLVRELLPRPFDKAAAVQRVKLLEGLGLAHTLEHGFLAVVEVEVDQGQPDLRQGARLAHQVAVDLRLRPVQGLLLVGDGLEAAAVGLDLVEPLLEAVVAIGAAPHRQRAPHRAQGHLALVARAPALGHQGVTGHAFSSAGSGSKSQVQIATSGGELAQLSHRHGVSLGWPWRVAGHGASW